MTVTNRKTQEKKRNTTIEIETVIIGWVVVLVRCCFGKIFQQREMHFRLCVPRKFGSTSIYQSVCLHKEAVICHNKHCLIQCDCLIKPITDRTKTLSYPERRTPSYEKMW